MAKKIQHLRGTYEEYAKNNLTLLEGEIALEEGENGYTRIKVGDGKTAYLALPYLTGTVREMTPDADGKLALTLSEGFEYRCGAISSLDIFLPETMREDFASSFVFDTGLVPPSLTYPKELVFYGDDCEGGMFFPEARKRYTVNVKNRTDAVYGEVRGASHDLSYVSYYEVGSEKLGQIGAFQVDNPDRILDVCVMGYLGEADSDGYIRGLGSYDSSTQKYCMRLVWQNGVMVDYDELLKNIDLDGSYIRNKTGFLQEEKGFSYLASTTTFMTLTNSGYQPIASGFAYRLRARFSLIDSNVTFTPGAVMNSPFTAYYGTEIKKIPMTHIQDGVFEVDFTSDIHKKLTRINFTGIGQSGRLFFAKNSVTLVAVKDGYTTPQQKQRVDADIYIDAPLLATDDCADMLSLLSQSVIRRIEPVLLTSFSQCDIAGDYAVFKKKLTVPMHVDLMAKMLYFTEQYCIEDVAMYPCSYYCDPFDGDGVFYFSADESVTSVSEMHDWILNRYQILGFVYPKSIPSVEKTNLSTALIPYEGYTFLMLRGATGGSFLVKRYTNEEKQEDDDYYEDDYYEEDY